MVETISGFETIRLIENNEPICVYINGQEEWITYNELSRETSSRCFHDAHVCNRFLLM